MARILIADDAAFMRGSLKFIIEQAGHEVVGTARDGKEALDLYLTLKPDLVTMDILMKGMDGLMALEALLKMDPDAKVVMVTTLGQQEKQKTAESIGARGYIRKPFKQSEIVAEIIRILTENEG